jgi:hypothetical protein
VTQPWAVAVEASSRRRGQLNKEKWKKRTNGGGAGCWVAHDLKPEGKNRNKDRGKRGRGADVRLPMV